jgi:hypothetical protein
LNNRNSEFVKKILQSPDALQQFEVLHKAVEAEKRRQHEFRAWITPDVKVEFVNGETPFSRLTESSKVV